MKVRLIEEHDPIKNTTIYYVERTRLGMWLGFLSWVESSTTHRSDVARELWERVKKTRCAGKTRRVIDKATL